MLWSTVAALFILLYCFRGLACDHLCRLPCLCIVACPFDSVEGLLSPSFFARDTIKGVMFLIVDNYRSRWLDAPVIWIFGCLLEVGDGDDHCLILKGPSLTMDNLLASASL